LTETSGTIVVEIADVDYFAAAPADGPAAKPSAPLKAGRENDTEAVKMKAERAIIFAEIFPINSPGFNLPPPPRVGLVFKI